MLQNKCFINHYLYRIEVLLTYLHCWSYIVITVIVFNTMLQMFSICFGTLLSKKDGENNQNNLIHWKLKEKQEFGPVICSLLLY